MHFFYDQPIRALHIDYRRNGLASVPQTHSPGVGIYFIVALTAGVCGSVMGVMGIVADICYEWSKTVIEDGVSPIYFAAFFVSLVYYIFWNGKTKFFERSLAVIVAVMSACFLINFFLMMPPPSQMLSGLIPGMPTVAAGSSKSLSLVIASMIGTTVFSGLFIIRTTLVKEAGWTLFDYKKQRNDAIFSVSLMFIISASIMAAAAGSLYVEGIGLSKTSQMITLLEPLAGSLATSVCHRTYRRRRFLAIPERFNAAMVDL